LNFAEEANTNKQRKAAKEKIWSLTIQLAPIQDVTSKKEN